MSTRMSILAALAMALGASGTPMAYGAEILDADTLMLVEELAFKKALDEAVAKATLTPSQLDDWYKLKKEANERFMARLQEERIARWKANPYRWKEVFGCWPSEKRGWRALRGPPQECGSYWLRIPVDVDGNATGPGVKMPYLSK